MRSLVDQALRIVHVPIISCTSRAYGLRRIGQIQEDKAGKTGAVARLSTVHVEEVVLLRSLNDVVHTSQGKLVPVTGKISVRAEGDRAFLVINIEQFLEIEDLNAVARFLAADNDVVLVRANLTPLARSDTGCLRKTPEVSELASRGDFSKSSTVTLRNDGEFSAVVTDPSPGT